jgi:hypothetical protein
MKPFPLNVKRFRYPDGRQLCQGCLDAVADLARATGAEVHAHGRVTLDAGDPRTKALWQRIVACKAATAGTNHPTPTAKATAAVRPPDTVRKLCPVRVDEWRKARGEERFRVLEGLFAVGPNGPKVALDLASDKVKAFLAEEGDAARVLLSACP